MKQPGMRYMPPISKWARGQHTTVQAAFQHWMRPYKKPVRYNGVADMKYERQMARYDRRRNRSTVGLIRAFGAPQFFRGCYPGAEND